MAIRNRVKCYKRLLLKNSKLDKQTRYAKTGCENILYPVNFSKHCYIARRFQRVITGGKFTYTRTSRSMQIGIPNTWKIHRSSILNDFFNVPIFR